MGSENDILGGQHQETGGIEANPINYPIVGETETKPDKLCHRREMVSDIKTISEVIAEQFKKAVYDYCGKEDKSYVSEMILNDKIKIEMPSFNRKEFWLFGKMILYTHSFKNGNNTIIETVYLE